MADSVTYIRDAKSGDLVPIKLEDETGSYTSMALILAEIAEDKEVRNDGR